MLIPTAFSGGTIVLMKRWDPENAMQLIERERCTTAGGVPTIGDPLNIQRGRSMILARGGVLREGYRPHRNWCGGSSRCFRPARPGVAGA